MDDFDDDEAPRDLGWGPIIVRRKVYEEGEKMLDAAPAGEGDTFETARGIGDDHKWSNEPEKAEHWYAVADYLEQKAAVSEGVKTIILEEGEEWDALAGRKRRRRRQKGRGTGGA